MRDRGPGGAGDADRRAERLGVDASLGDGEVVVYRGDEAADAVELGRYVDTQHDQAYYLVSDDGGREPGQGCFRVSSTLVACPVSDGLKR